MQAVAAVLSNFGIPQNAIECFIRLLLDLEVNHVLTFPPMEVSSHQLACEDFRLAAAASGAQ